MNVFEGRVRVRVRARVRGLGLDARDKIVRPVHGCYIEPITTTAAMML